MRSRIMLLLLVAALLTWLFAPALSGRSSFAFRDAAHYYHPLFEYLRGEWRAGRLPLWNPYENLGSPLVGENTTSLFYPGKLLFALPLDYIWLYNSYIVLHVVLAAATSYWLARRLGASVLASGVASLSYAFSGSVLFQYCNVIFLVGAAWLPLAWMYVDRLLRERCGSAVLGVGIVLALIVLGGDPQLAYNLAIVAACYGLLLWSIDRRRPLDSSDPPPEATTAKRRWIRSRPIGLASGLALAGLLSAVQVLPSFEATPHSGRSQYSAPRNIYELAQDMFRGNADSPTASIHGMFRENPRGHHGEIYYFSLEPWRVVELLWPNVTGRPFPTDRRWLKPLHAESSVWVPSLYFGLLPLLLAMSTWSVRRSVPAMIQGISWLVVFGVLGSLGWYGLAWLLGLLLGSSASLGIGGEVGGLYWLLTTFLPGYVQFRYPAKLFLFASLGWSVLAAFGWDRFWINQQSWIPRCLAAIPPLSIALIVAARLAWPYVQPYYQDANPSKLLGPFDTPGAWSDLNEGLLHTTFVSLSLLVLIWLAGRTRPQVAGQTQRGAAVAQVALLVMVAIDLGAAQQHLLVYAPSELWRTLPPVLSQLPHASGFGRVYRPTGSIPPSFQETRSDERYFEALSWDRQTLFPRYPLPLRVPMANFRQTVAGGDYYLLLQLASEQNRRAGGPGIPPSDILDLLGVDAVLLDEPSKQLPNAREFAEGMYLAHRSTALPRAWIVRQIEQRPRLDTNSRRHVRRFLSELMFPEGQIRDWRNWALVESDVPIRIDAGRANESERCEILAAEPLRVELDVQLDSPGLVVLADQYYPGWQASVETNGVGRAVPILRTNRVMRGVLLPAGEHRVIFQYRPRSVLLGAAISVLTCLSLCGWAGYGWWSGRKISGPNQI